MAQPEVLEQAVGRSPPRVEEVAQGGSGGRCRRPIRRADFLRTRDGWVLGYTADIAVSDDHFIVAARVTQNATDNASLLPMVDEVERQCRQRPAKVTADAGFFSGSSFTGVQ